MPFSVFFRALARFHLQSFNNIGMVQALQLFDVHFRGAIQLFQGNILPIPFASKNRTLVATSNIVFFEIDNDGLE